MAIVDAAPGAGAYITDINLGVLSKQDIALIRESLGNYGVLFFRGQSVTSKQHIEFAQHFGEININRFFKPLTDYPQIAEVRKEPEQGSNIGSHWHTDHSYDQIPALGSILVAQELPPSGGDTIFANMFAAYDALTPEMKSKIHGLSATHSSRHAFGPKAYEKGEHKDLIGRLGNTALATQDAIHPVVIKHPISGKRAIYVNPDFTTHINEVGEAESSDLLRGLYQHCQRLV